MIPGVGALIKAAIGPVFGIIDKAVTDKDKAAELKYNIQAMVMDYEARLLDAQASIIRTEAAGTGLKAHWRPITMLVFVAIVVSYWFGYQPEDMTQETINEIFTLIKIGLGGYVVGRSGEKIAGIIKNGGNK